MPEGASNIVCWKRIAVGALAKVQEPTALPKASYLNAAVTFPLALVNSRVFSCPSMSR
jgi:hypothetical protein